MSWNSSLATTVGGVIAKEARSVGINRGLCPVLQVITDCRFCRYENACLSRHFHTLKESSFYQDRLGTNIRR
jgi:beta-glucosidase-like glycosyl hydrolase